MERRLNLLKYAVDGLVADAKLLIAEGADINSNSQSGITPLHISSHYGHLPFVKLLIKHGAQVNQSMNNGRTALHESCQSGHLNVVRYLVEHHANVDQREDDGWSPLQLASQEGHLRVVEYLFENGARVNNASNDGKTALHGCCQTGHVSVVKFLISNGANVNACSLKGVAPLYLASQRGRLAIVQYLIQHEALANQATIDGRTAMHPCCQNGHLEVAKVLINNGVKAYCSSEIGLTPLHLSLQNGHYNMVQFLIEEGAEVSKAKANGRTALHQCCQNGHTKVAELLIEKGADVNVACNSGVTPLHVSSENGRVDTVMFLLSKKAILNKRRSNGRTPLHQCCQQGHLDVVTCLVENGADVGQGEQDGWTPLQLASQEGHLDIVEYLIRNGAVVNQTRNNGRTALHQSCQQGHLDITDVLIHNSAEVNVTCQLGVSPLYLSCEVGRVQLIQCLILHGALVNTPDGSTGRTALHQSCQNGHLEAARILIDNGADVNSVSQGGLTPLYLASQHGHLGIVNLLIQEGVAVNHASDFGRTPLHQCCVHGHMEVAKCLINNHAKVNAADENGLTPLHTYVINHGELDFIKYLLYQGARIDQGTVQSTPLHIASAQGNGQAVSSLVSLGCDVNVWDEAGKTAFIKAASADKPDALKVLEDVADVRHKDYEGNDASHHAVISDQNESVKYLLEIGMNVNTVNNIKRTPLHFACEYGFLTVANTLLSNGGDLESQDKDKNTPLHLASREGLRDMVQFLLDHGASTESEDKGNRTPLLSASARGQSDTVNLLLQAQSRIVHGDFHGRTALHLAASYGYSDIVHQLIEFDPSIAGLLDNSGLTAAQHAEYKGYHDIAKYLNMIKTDQIGASQVPHSIHEKTSPQQITEIPSLKITSRPRVLQEVDRFVTMLCAGKLGPTWTCKRVGSSFEGTRIGEPNECDYLLADMRIQVGALLDEYYVNDGAFCRCIVPPNFPEEYCEAVQFGGRRNLLSSTQFHRIFRDKVSEHLYNLELSDCLVRCADNVQDEFKRQAAASKCTLLWLGRDNFEGMDIDTDLVPTVIMDAWPKEARRPEELMPGLEYCEPLFENRTPYTVLVAKPPHTCSDLAKSMSQSEMDCLWRIDFAHVCSRIVASLPPRLKNVYIMAKALRGDMGHLVHPDTGKPIFKEETTQEEHEVKDLVTSYQLKVTFLHEVRDTFWNNSKLTLDQMVLTLYNKLVLYLEDGFFPDFVLHKSDILAGTKHRHEDCLPAARFARDCIKKQIANGGLNRAHLKSAM